MTTRSFVLAIALISARGDWQAGLPPIAGSVGAIARWRERRRWKSIR